MVSSGINLTACILYTHCIYWVSAGLFWAVISPPYSGNIRESKHLNFNSILFKHSQLGETYTPALRTGYLELTFYIIILPGNICRRLKLWDPLQFCVHCSVIVYWHNVLNWPSADDIKLIGNIVWESNPISQMSRCLCCKAVSWVTRIAFQYHFIRDYYIWAWPITV